MAQSVLRHEEDDGTLSIIASGGAVLVACENGHYWALDVKQQTKETVKAALEEMTSVEDADRLFRQL